jgi:CRP-like cAMP-binding protein
LEAPVDLDPKEYVQTVELLKKIDFFGGVPDTELKSTLLSIQKQVYSANKTILFQGEIANRLFIIRSGSVIITTKSKGQKLALAELSEGSYFGEISLLTPQSATATATAGDNGADLLLITHDTMTFLSKKIPDIQDRIKKTIQSRLDSKKKAKEKDEQGE